MTPDQINQRIAEWCEPMPDPLKSKWDSSSGLSRERFWRWKHFPSPGGSAGLWVPTRNFFGDLNACAEFERLVEERGMWPEYAVSFIVENQEIRVKELWQKSPGCSGYCVSAFIALTATAERRCQALLRVIESEKEEECQTTTTSS